MITMFLQDEEGATAIEYGLIAAVLAVAVILPFMTMGGQGMSEGFTELATLLQAVNP